MKKNLTLAILVLVGVGAAHDVWAIPAYARKYQTSCSTCHSAPPTLNTFGLSFKLNGYQFPAGDDLAVKDKPVKLGADAQKEEFPNSIWPSDLPNLPPIALRFFGDFEYNPKSRPTNNFDFPNFWRVLAGGSLDDDLSFFTSICFKSNMPPGMDKISTAVQFQAQLIHKDIAEKTLGENTLNVRYGLIDIRNLYWNNFFQHMIITNYLYGRKLSPETKNDFAFLEPGGTPGIEAYGLVTGDRLFWSATANNGDDFGSSDDNSGKDFSFILRYKFGGTPYGGKGAMTQKVEGADEGSQDPGSFLGWKNTSLQVGALFYNGTALVDGGSTDHFTRTGIDLHLQHGLEFATEKGGWDVTVAALWGKNDDPYGANSRDSIDTFSSYVEGMFILYPWLIPALRYENLKTDSPSDFATTDVDTARFVPSVTIRLRHNVKWTIEANVYTKNDAQKKLTGDASDANMILFRFDVAF